MEIKMGEEGKMKEKSEVVERNINAPSGNHAADSVALFELGHPRANINHFTSIIASALKTD